MSTPPATASDDEHCFGGTAAYCIRLDCLPAGVVVADTLLGTGATSTVWAGTLLPKAVAGGDDGAAAPTRVAIKVIPLDVNTPGEGHHAEDCDVAKPRTWRDCIVTTTDEFDHEARMFVRAARSGVAPRLHGTAICQVTRMAPLPAPFRAARVGIIVSDRVDTTLAAWLDAWVKKVGVRAASADDVPPRVVRLLEDLFARVHETGLYDYDLHDENVGLVLDTDGAPTRAYDIDVGNMRVREKDVDARPVAEIAREKTQQLLADYFQYSRHRATSGAASATYVQRAQRRRWSEAHLLQLARARPVLYARVRAVALRDDEE